MSINIGLYNFFSYTIPGLFYLAIVVYGAAAFGYVEIDYTSINSMSLYSALAIAGLAYVTGMVMDWLAEKWHSLFASREVYVRIYDKFHHRHKAIHLQLGAYDWTLYLAYMRKSGGEHIHEIERFNVNRVMLRNISLGLMILAVIHILYFFVVVFYQLNLVIGFALIALGIIAAHRGTRFAEWYFMRIFEAVVAEGMTAEDFFKIANPSQVEISSITDQELPATRETAVSGKQELLHRKDQRRTTRPQVKK